MVAARHQDKALLALAYKGPVHDPGNIFIYALEQKVLMVVDVLWPGWSPFNELGVAEDIPVYVQAYEKILQYDFTTFIGGHLNRLGTRAYVEETQRYIEDIRDNTRVALLDTSLAAIFGVVPPGQTAPLGAKADHPEQRLQYLP